jgi:hypothetical protein
MRSSLNKLCLTVPGIVLVEESATATCFSRQPVLGVALSLGVARGPFYLRSNRRGARIEFTSLRILCTRHSAKGLKPFGLLWAGGGTAEAVPFRECGRVGWVRGWKGLVVGVGWAASGFFGYALCASLRMTGCCGRGVVYGGICYVFWTGEWDVGWRVARLWVARP